MPRRHFPRRCFFLLLFFVPESPRWLVKKERTNEAKRILEKVGGSEHCRTELAAIEESFHHETKEKLSALWLPAYRPVLWMGIIIAVFQQITGINAILYYAPEIFKYTGVSNENALLQTIGIESIDKLIDKTIPESIRNRNQLSIPTAISEDNYLRKIKKF